MSLIFTFFDTAYGGQEGGSENVENFSDSNEDKIIEHLTQRMLKLQGILDTLPTMKEDSEELMVGTKIFARYGGYEKKYEAEIVADYNDNTYKVKYTDRQLFGSDDEEDKIDKHLIERRILDPEELEEGNNDHPGATHDHTDPRTHNNFTSSGHKTAIDGIDENWEHTLEELKLKNLELELAAGEEVFVKQNGNRWVSAVVIGKSGDGSESNRDNELGESKYKIKVMKEPDDDADIYRSFEEGEKTYSRKDLRLKKPRKDADDIEKGSIVILRGDNHFNKDPLLEVPCFRVHEVGQKTPRTMDNTERLQLQPIQALLGTKAQLAKPAKLVPKKDLQKLAFNFGSLVMVRLDESSDFFGYLGEVLERHGDAYVVRACRNSFQQKEFDIKNLLPVQFVPGQRVLALKQQEDKWRPAMIIEYEGDNIYNIEYEHEKIKQKNGKVGTNKYNKAFLKHIEYREHDLVVAEISERKYVATVLRDRLDGTFDVELETSEINKNKIKAERVKHSSMQPVHFLVGDKVLANLGKESWYPVEIQKRKDRIFEVVVDGMANTVRKVRKESLRPLKFSVNDEVSVSQDGGNKYDAIILSCENGYDEFKVRRKDEPTHNMFDESSEQNAGKRNRGKEDLVVHRDSITLRSSRRLYQASKESQRIDDTMRIAYRKGDKVEVFDENKSHWRTAIVLKVKADGTFDVEYLENEDYKEIQVGFHTPSKTTITSKVDESFSPISTSEKKNGNIVNLPQHCLVSLTSQIETLRESIENIKRAKREAIVIEQRLKAIVLGLTRAFQQANAHIMIESIGPDDTICKFICENAATGAVIVSSDIVGSALDQHNISFMKEHERGLNNFLDFIDELLEIKFCSQGKNNSMVNPKETDFNYFKDAYYSFLMKNKSMFAGERDVDNIFVTEIDREFVEAKICGMIITKYKKRHSNSKINADGAESIDNKDFKAEKNELKKLREENAEKLIKSLVKEQLNRIIPMQGLTNLTIFEDSVDHARFTKYINTSVPCGFIAMGGCFQSFDRSEQCIRMNMPLFVVDQTGGSSNIVCDVLRYARKRNFDLQLLLRSHDFPHGEDEEEDYGIDFNERRHLFHSEKMIEIQEQARILLQSWPNGFKKESYLVIDPMRDKVESVQDQVTKTMNSLFDEQPELGSKAGDFDRLVWAWQRFDLLQSNADRLMQFVDLYVYLTASLTCTAVFVTVLKGSDVAVSISDSFLGAIAVVLPILAGVAFTAKNAFKPFEKWAVCEVACRMIESEIYKFKTRTGPYRASNTRTRNMQGTAGTAPAREEFARRISEIWSSIATSDMKEGSLQQRKRGGNMNLQNHHSFREKAHEIKRRQNNFHNNNFRPDGLDVEENKNAAYTIEGRFSEHTSGYSNTSRPVSGTRPSPMNMSGDGSYLNMMSNDNMKKTTSMIGSLSPYKVAPELDEPEHVLTLDDCRLSIDEYMITRFEEVYDNHKTQAPRLDKIITRLRFFIFVFTSMGAMLVYLGLAGWVAVLMAIAASLSSIIDDKQMPIRLMASNNARIELEKLICYWQGLSVIERRRFSTASYIVETVESTVIAELLAYSQSIRSQQAASENNKRDKQRTD